MICDLFVNACVVIAFISIMYHVFRGKSMTGLLSLRFKICGGIISGILGIWLMYYSVHVDSTVILDFRNIPVILAAIYGGTIPAIISVTIMSGFRLIYFGVSKSSITAVIILILISIGCSLISSLNIPKKRKWIYSVLCSLIIGNAGLVYLIDNLAVLKMLLPIYCLVTIGISVITYQYTKYLDASSSLFRKLKNEASKDFLTELNNVRSFNSMFNSLICQAQEKKEKLSLLFIDIDFFKRVNDTFGHHNGDIVLKELGCLLTSTCRSFDIVSRNGGEEFSVMLLDCSKCHALEIAEKIRKKVEEHDFILSDGTKINITISIGVSTYPDIITEPDKLLESADSALYEAKQTGRNKVVVFSEHN